MNNGTFLSFGLAVHSTAFHNTGEIEALGSMRLQGRTASLEGGSTLSGSDSRFFVETLRLGNDSYIGAIGGLFLAITNEIVDVGGGLVQTENGFNLLRRPLVGDFMGTVFESFTPDVPAATITHSWAGEDRGASPAGFTNNAAIGTLSLIPLSPDPLYFFRGTGQANALYVDVLDLSQLSDYANQIQIHPSLKIYYASAILSFTPPDTNGVPQTPEEFLDGQFNGRLRWVPGFAGPNSSETLDGQLVNQALRNSRLLDSDNDGTVNADDPTPFVTAALSVNVFGKGTVVPDYSLQQLIVGQTYTVVAQPGQGASFAGWTGSLESSSPVLTFEMQPGLELTANFSFAPTQATYTGLFFETNGIQFLRSGLLTITVTPRGRYSGFVQVGTTRRSFSGQLDEEGVGTAFVSGTPLTVEFQAGTNQITGTVTDGDWVAQIVADQTGFDKRNRAPFAGQYTMIFPGSSDPNDSMVPFGTGYATVRVSTSGKVKLTGALADGTRISQSASASRNGFWPLYVPLYKGGGHLLGWQLIGNTGDKDIGGLFSWIKEPIGGQFYPDGFNFETNAIGSKYVSTNAPVTGFDRALLRLMGGNLADTVSTSFAINGSSKATNLQGTKSSLTINKGTGTFKANVIDPATERRVRVQGVILQKQQSGAGFFLGEDRSGRADLVPN